MRLSFPQPELLRVLSDFTVGVGVGECPGSMWGDLTLLLELCLLPLINHGVNSLWGILLETEGVKFQKDLVFSWEIR